MFKIVLGLWLGWAKAVSLWSWLGLGGLGEAGLVGGPGWAGFGWGRRVGNRGMWALAVV